MVAEDNLIVATTKGSVSIAPSLRVTTAIDHVAPAIRANIMPFPLILPGVEFVIRVDVSR